VIVSDALPGFTEAARKTGNWWCRLQEYNFLFVTFRHRLINGEKASDRSACRFAFVR
jgi:hypothetical protein